ncbi:MAG: hypothetical protein E5Y79_22225 [Mesorhizobium sp.]|nr:MAG: hypothetical protein E5Y79_22225 [Mesorhizobium sp.]
MCRRDVSALAFLAGHLGAFERWGGIPKVVLYDNLKSAVLERPVRPARLDIYDVSRKPPMTTPDPEDGRDRAARLHLRGLVAHWQDATQGGWALTLLDWEEDERASSQDRRLKDAKIGQFKPLCDFDWSFPTRCDRQAIEALMGLLTAQRTLPGSRASRTLEVPDLHGGLASRRDRRTLPSGRRDGSPRNARTSSHMLGTTRDRNYRENAVSETCARDLFANTSPGLPGRASGAGNQTKVLIDRHPVNQSGKRIQRRMLAAINGRTKLFLTNAPT